MKRGYLASAIALLALPGSALAQSPDSQQIEKPSSEQTNTHSSSNEGASLEEVIVTATRRNELLQDVPLSVTNFSQKQLSEKGIVGYEGLARETPGVTMNKASANFNNFTTRGLATNGYNANLQATTGIYIDEMPVSANGNSTVLDPNLYDTKRVEVLRGPQGTLFGSSSMAGAIRILTEDPQLDVFDYSTLVDSGITGDDSVRQRYNGMVNVPLVDDELALRIVGFYRHEEGYLDNVGTGIDNANTLEDWGGRAIALWEPTERFSLRLMAMYEDSYPEDSSLTSPELGRNKRISGRPDIFSAKLRNYNATVEYQFDGAQLISSSSVMRFDQKFFIDLANTFDFAIPFRLDASAYDDVFVQETRLISEGGGDWDWLVGLYYFDKRRDVDRNYRSTVEFLNENGITNLSGDTYQQFNDHAKHEEYAGFGQLTYHLSDKFWITGGLRYGSNGVQNFVESGGFSSDYLNRSLAGLEGPVNIGSVETEVGEKGELSRVTWKTSASYKPSPSVTTYATIATGFRPPIVNRNSSRESVVDPDDIIIPDIAESDELVNYEVGLKGSWFGGRLATELAAYLIDWSDIQVQANRVSDQVQFATNIGGAESRGIEFAINAMPLDGLNLSLSGSVNEAEVTDLTSSEAAISGAVDGARLAFPHFQGTATARYDFDITSDWRGFAVAAVTHVGSFPGLFPNLPGQPGAPNPVFDETDTFNNVNMQLGVTTGELIITAYVENMLDDDSITYVHPEAFAASRSGVLRPRTVGLRVGFGL